MKNQKLFLKLVLAIILVAIAFLLKPINANATISGNENYRLVVVTTINNWETQYDLAELYLNTENTSGSVSDSNNNVSLGYSVSFYLSDDEVYDNGDEPISSGSLYSDKFSSGSNVYLLEVYDFEVSDGYALDDRALTFTLPCNNYVSSYISNTALQNAIMSNYSSSFSPTAFVDGVYNSSEVNLSNDYDDRDYYNMIYFNTGSKTDTISRGTITNPKFFVSFTGTASGNILPHGSFNVGSGDGTVTQVTYSQFKDFANATITYEGSDDYYINEDNGSHSFTQSQEGYNFTDETNLASNEHVTVDEDGCNYTVSRSMNVVNNKDNPTGIFYNVLPFVVAIVIAGAGVVLLKKNSIQ